MAFYENTLLAKQDLADKDLKEIKEKYNNLINTSSGKVLKIEEWGLLNLAKKIKNYKKAFYIHYKFEGDRKTINEINSKIKIDRSIISKKGI
jgi:small subunit ribosomal protein S6